MIATVSPLKQRFSQNKGPIHLQVRNPRPTTNFKHMQPFENRPRVDLKKLLKIKARPKRLKDPNDSMQH